MSVKVAILKKVHKDIRRSKGKLVLDIAREMLTMPLKERLRLALKIIFKGRI